LDKPLEDIYKMNMKNKRGILMNFRKEQLRKLIQTYYAERGWNANGVPKVETLKKIGLWDFLNGETQTKITEMNS
jgi:aldehyde:ferredoxin oxidoreductase